MRQWAEVDFVPGERGEKKDSQPLRYIGLRLLKAQGELFADGSDRHHHAIKGLCFEADERTARMKQFRMLLIHLMGRMNRNNCVMGLRLCASEQAIARMLKVWEIFQLPTQATSVTVTGRGGGVRPNKKKN